MISLLQELASYSTPLHCAATQNDFVGLENKLFIINSLIGAGAMINCKDAVIIIFTYQEINDIPSIKLH